MITRRLIRLAISVVLSFTGVACLFVSYMSPNQGAWFMGGAVCIYLSALILLIGR